MALTITQAGSNFRTTSGSSVVVSSITASVGDLLIVMIAADNAGNNGASSISTTTDSASNTWTTQSTTNRSSGSANDGVTLRITTSVLTNALSSGSVTVDLSPNTTNAAVLVWRVQPDAGEAVGVMDVGSGSAAGLSSYSVTASGVLSGATVFGAVAVESTSNNPAADSDTTNGSWSSAYTEFSSDARISSQYKTVTATGDQTFNGSLGATLDRAANWITVAPVHYRRIYLPSSGAAAISPAFAAGWEKSSDADRIKAVFNKTSTTMASVASSETSTSNVYDVLLRQYILGPLAAGLDFTSGTLDGVIQASESNTAANMRAQMAVRTIQSDGTTVRNTLLDFSAATFADEFPATLAGRYFPMQGSSTTLASQSAVAGDYLAIELGYRATNTSSTSYTGTLRFGDTGSTDLAYDSTTDNPPWLEFKTWFNPLVLLEDKGDTDNAAANATEAESISIDATDADSAAANVSETEDIVATDEVTPVSDADTYSANVTEADSLFIDLAVDDTDNNAANVGEDDAIGITATDADSAAANATEAEAIALADTDNAAANATEAEGIEVQGDFAPLGLRVDVYDAAGNKVSTGPVLTILACSYEMGLDRVGAFSLAVPADSEDADLLALEREVRIYRESEGLVFRGIIARRSYSIGADGQRVLDIAGDSIARQLVKRSTLLGLSFSGAALSAVVGGNATAGSLLHGTGWSAGSLATPSTTLLARYDGLSRWEALTKAAEVFGLHVREDNLTKEIDVIAAGTASGIVLQNVEQWTPELAENRGLFPVTQVGVEEQSQDLVNRLVPLGAGEGINQLTLRYANRTSPYTVQNATGPDGSTYYYIEDAASVASYGVNERVVSVKEAIPLANSTSGYQAAANALYDVAATALGRSAEPLTSYSVSVAGLRHVDNGAALFEPGQTMRLVYRGLTTDEDGSARSWLDVDENLYLMGFSRSFDSTGADSWSLTLNTADRFDVDPAGKLADTFSAVHALQVALRYYTYHEVHILERTSIASGSTASMTVKWDGNVSLLHQAKLTFKVSALRSNVTVAASGGGTTSSSAGGQEKTSSSGGSTTSSSESSHTHAITVSSISSAGDHRHRIAYSKTSVTTTTSNNSAGHTHDYSSSPPATTGSNSVAHTHTQDVLRYIVQANSLVGDISTAYLWMPDGGSGSATEIYTDDAGIGNHTHTASATSAAGSSHSHTVSAHTHTVTIDAHTHTVSAHEHNLTYGIYTATAPTNPAIGISINGTTRTVALGGPWNTVGSEVEVDITQYLQAASSEVPLQQSNEIVFSGAVLADVSAVLRSRVTASSLLPV